MTNPRPITAIDVRKCLLATGRNPNDYDEQALTDRCEGVPWADLELFVHNQAWQYLKPALPDPAMLD